MPSEFKKLLIGFATDPTKAKQFWENPAQLAAQLGLSPAQTNALVSRDPELLASALQADLAASDVQVADDGTVVDVVVVVLPV